MPSTATQPLHKQVWEDPKTFATTMLIVFVDRYGTEGFNWDPETIVMEINEDFNVQISQGNLDRLMAAINIVTGEDFYRSLPDFVNLCNILNGDLLDPGEWDPADAEDIAWGVTEAWMLSPPDEEEPFTEEIRAYIGQVLDNEGITNPPDTLRFALRDRDPTVAIQNDFSDDAELFSAIQGFEQSKTDDVNQHVQQMLAALNSQLALLSLSSGDAGDVIHKVLGA